MHQVEQPCPIRLRKLSTTKTTTLFAVLLGAVALLVESATAGAQTTVRVREDIDIVARDPAKLSALKLAFQTLRDSKDPKNNLRFWANIHGAVPPDVSTGPCIHKEEAIWAWHRSYLWQFENTLRNSHLPETSQVTLPYWNWVAAPSGKRYPSAYEDTTSSLFWPNRITSPFNNAPVPANSESQLLSISDWRTFGGVPDSESPGKGHMESTVHDAVHGFVGKDMASTSTSARDPIFWAHHANLDRIWLEWYQKWGQAPSEATLPLAGVDGTQGDWVDVSKKYTYGPPATMPLLFLAHRAPTSEALQAALITGERLRLAGVQERVHLVISNIEYPKDVGPFVNARIYLVPPDVGVEARTPAFAQSHYLGYFTDWLTSHHQRVHKGAARSHSITLDVTERARAIQAIAGNEPLALSFELISQNADGKQTPLRFGSGGMTFNARLEVVTVERGQVTLIQNLEMKSRR